ncbi:MAG: strawberry notch family protein, partial [Methanosarcinaceae archaeon]|nr:strawberry notch family protein [Methanosarcinaceae archaeon]
MSIEFLRHDVFYDMYVPGPENYVAEGIVHHNTGVGKGREIAAIMWDNWNRGRKKAIWLSEKDGLFKDAQRDFNQVGWSSNKLFNHSATPATDKDNQGNQISSKIKADEGVLFTTYNKLGTARDADDFSSRFDQIVDWVGKDFDGVIAFDEAHNMGNSVDDTSGRYTRKASKQALAGVELQARLPKARVVYTSATGATTVMNLAYADRLGLWGEGTAFADKMDFIQKISAGGIAAMELVATDMKAMGLYMSRALSYDGVEQETLVHKLSTEQINSYNKLVEGWQVVLNNIHDALVATGAIDDHTGRTVSASSVSNAMSAFWGANQRFFNQVITSMQTPSLIKSIRKDLAAGRSPVVQLTSTFEAATTRALARLKEDQTLDDLDLTPRDGLMQMVQGSFPVAQIETFVDDHGNQQSRVVRDSKGNVVLNSEAVALREKLLDEIGSIAVPQGSLDMLLDEFGTDIVSEVTGRTKRVVNKITEKGTEKVVESWSRVKSTNDAELFMNDRKKILVFSEAGGTGRSYHSDLSAKNQRKRIHYLLQPGWRADKAIQGLGRTHRSNQATPPKYFLVTTDLKGQKRFVATIARRLDQLGALTKGQRETGSSGLFDARDNLESIYAENALRVLFGDLARGNVRSITVQDFENQTGLKLINPTTGGLNSSLPGMRQFLNRLLSLKYETQDQFFDEFMMRMDSIVSAHIAAGTLDQGLETLKAEKIEKISEETVRTDKRTGAETKYVQLDVTRKTAIQTFSEAKSYEARFIQNKKSGKVWQVKRVVLTDREGGNAQWYYLLKGEQYQSQRFKETEFPMDKWDQLTEAVAEPLWQAQVDAAPKLRVDRYHLMTGTLLPVWDRLVGHPRIFRVQTEAGERMIGRLIPQKDLSTTLKNVGAEASKIDITPEQIFDKLLDEGQTVTFANSWELKRRLVSGDERIEITGLDYNQFAILERKGAFSERITWKTRYFIPTDKAIGAKVIKSILTNNPVVSTEGGTTVDYRLSKSAATTQETQNLQKISSSLKGWLAKAGLDQEVMSKVDVALRSTIPAPGQKGTVLGSTTISQTAAITNTKALIQLAVSVQDLKSLEQTAYHEAFHLAIAWILPHKEIAELIRHFGTEEDAADAFMEYMYKRSTIYKSPSPIRKLLMKIQRTLQIIRNGLKGLGFNRPEDIFGQLSVGVYKPHFKGKPGTRYQVEAWHGGPYAFDKFSTEKIGAGEGGKAFGWGLYFSDLKEIGERYSKTVDNDTYFNLKRRIKNEYGLHDPGEYLLNSVTMVMTGNQDINVIRKIFDKRLLAPKGVLKVKDHDEIVRALQA